LEQAICDDLSVRLVLLFNANGLRLWMTGKLMPLSEGSEGDFPEIFDGASSDAQRIRLSQPSILGGGMQLIHALGTAEWCDVSSILVT
jgi:hypothetical protein